MEGLIYQLMAKVMKDVKNIPKSQKNKSQGFNFRGIDDVYEGLHGILAEHEIFCAPRVISTERGEYTTSKDTTMQHVTTMVEYTFYATDGSSVSMVSVGEGGDIGDKALSKSLSMAHKYNLIQAFLIPTNEPDPDGESVDLSGGKREAQKKEAPAPQPASSEKGRTLLATDKQINFINVLLKELSVTDEHAQALRVSAILNLQETINAMGELTRAQAKQVIEVLLMARAEQDKEPQTEAF